MHQLTPHTLPDVASLLKQLDGIRNGELAYDIEEHKPEVCAIGIALSPRHGQLLGVSVAMPASRFAAIRGQVEDALRALRGT